MTKKQIKNLRYIIICILGIGITAFFEIKGAIKMNNLLKEEEEIQMKTKGYVNEHIHMLENYYERDKNANLTLAAGFITGIPTLIYAVIGAIDKKEITNDNR